MNGEKVKMNLKENPINLCILNADRQTDCVTHKPSLASLSDV